MAQLLFSEFSQATWASIGGDAAFERAWRRQRDADQTKAVDESRLAASPPEFAPCRIGAKLPERRPPNLLFGVRFEKDFLCALPCLLGIPSRDIHCLMKNRYMPAKRWGLPPPSGQARKEPT